MELVRLLRWSELVATLFMTGLIWFVQVVHYPLFAKVGAEHAIAYQTAHMERTGWVVAVPMLVEAGACALLTFRGDLPSLIRWPGALLLAVVWIATAVLLVPAHEALARGFDASVHARLVGANWIRTFAWSARAALCTYAMARATSVS
jgi:hypothetical protein